MTARTSPFKKLNTKVRSTYNTAPTFSFYVSLSVSKGTMYAGAFNGCGSRILDEYRALEHGIDDAKISGRKDQLAQL